MDSNNSFSIVKTTIENMNELSIIIPSAHAKLGELDKICERISKRIDYLMHIKSSNPNTKEEIKILQSIIDSIFPKKNEILINSYDLIDNHVKLIDQIVDASENILQEISINNGDMNRENFDVSSTERIQYKSSFVRKNEDEPLYCFCRQIFFGEMIACDNEQCEIEWFHYPCVGLVTKPESEWICKACLTQKKGKEKTGKGESNKKSRLK
jgi:hypothetical protein